VGHSHLTAQERGVYADSIRLHVEKVNASHPNVWFLVLGLLQAEYQPHFSCFQIWNSYITVHLREIGWDGMDWIDLSQGRDQWRDLVNTVMSFRVP
jgi:hypothetical protein